MGMATVDVFPLGINDQVIDVRDGQGVAVVGDGSRYARSRYDRWVKPVFDGVAGAVLLLLVLPVLFVTAVVIRCSLGRGVFYVQERVGRNGRTFRMYKFRTMRHDRRCRAVGYDGPDRRVCHKRDDDPRHTRVGGFLRRTSLDELPQVLNVLRGDMSLVGPRPELVDVVKRYEPWQHARHCVKPGITGYWQIKARDRLASEGVQLDIEYLGRRSFRTDCSILVRTVPSLLRGTGR
jgi:lipopolysaccharide/colanic/teichoic acid biosynthesis glycosyltransferase